jgi:hypothetical protein
LNTPWLLDQLLLFLPVSFISYISDEKPRFQILLSGLFVELDLVTKGKTA